MKIVPVNNLYYSSKLSFAADTGKKTTAPFLVEYPKCDNGRYYEYEEEFADNFLRALNDRKDELYTYLDSVADDKGLTMADKLLSMFDTENMEIKEDTFLHKTSSENVESLQKNGFDPAKIRQTNFGPGVYVGTSEGSLLIYSGVKMQVKYKGNTAKGKDLSEFNTIRTGGVNKLMEYLDLNPDFSSPFVWKELEVLGKFMNEYSRRTIVEKLGIDGAWAGGSDGYFVIFNPDAVKEMKQSDY